MTTCSADGWGGGRGWGSSEGYGNESTDAVKVRDLLVPERLSACRELCSVELHRNVNIALFTTAPVFVCHSVEFWPVFTKLGMNVVPLEWFPAFSRRSVAGAWTYELGATAVAVAERSEIVVRDVWALRSSFVSCTVTVLWEGEVWSEVKWSEVHRGVAGPDGVFEQADCLMSVIN